MHFSSPSGQRLSWWRPWNRGAVGFFSNGYSSVNTLRNIVRKVTPNPATGSQRDSLTVFELATAAVVHSAHRLDEGWWDRVSPGEGVEVGRLDRLLLVLLGLRLLGQEQRDHRGQRDDARGDQQVVALEVDLAADGADGGDQHDP